MGRSPYGLAREGARGRISRARSNALQLRSPGQVDSWIDLTPEEAHAIIAASPVFGRNKRPVRPYFQVLWETGLRPETIVSIEAPGDYRRGSDTLRIRAEADKARYARVVPLTPGAREALDSVCPEAGFLFARAPDGDAPKVNNELRKAARLAGLEPARANRISPYDLRHGRATELVHKTDLLSTSYLLGHKHASTTDRYIHGRKEMAVLALAKLASSAALKPAITASSPSQQTHDGRSSLVYRRYADDITFSAPPSGSGHGEPTPQDPEDPQKPDFGHTLATVSVSSLARDLAQSPNPATSHQCEEQDLNLHTLRYRNLKVETSMLKHWIY
ncbi:MAG: hypothetical protein JWN04_697 [Myxococcaceae bacterium]|nr:hypothetical protein [Myxococcaceae bacterium]